MWSAAKRVLHGGCPKPSRMSDEEAVREGEGILTTHEDADPQRRGSGQGERLLALCDYLRDVAQSSFQPIPRSGSDKAKTKPKFGRRRPKA